MTTLLWMVVGLTFAMSMMTLALSLFLLYYLHALYEEVVKKLIELGFE